MVSERIPPGWTTDVESAGSSFRAIAACAMIFPRSNTQRRWDALPEPRLSLPAVPRYSLDMLRTYSSSSCSRLRIGQVQKPIKSVTNVNI